MGIPGQQGPPGRDGADGKDGRGINIKDSFPDYGALKAAHPVGDNGYGYIIKRDLYVWSPDDSNWVNTGKIQGPKGEQGAQGIPGPQGPPGISISGGGGTAGGGSLPVGAVISAVWDAPSMSNGGVEFLLMDGRAVLEDEYPALFKLVGGALPNIPPDSHGLRRYVLAYIPSGVLPIFSINDAGNLTVALTPGERTRFRVDGRGHLLMAGLDNRYVINRESGHLEFRS
jgi:hypothetical protein